MSNRITASEARKNMVEFIVNRAYLEIHEQISNNLYTTTSIQYRVSDDYRVIDRITEILNQDGFKVVNDGTGLLTVSWYESSSNDNQIKTSELESGVEVPKGFEVVSPDEYLNSGIAYKYFDKYTNQWVPFRVPFRVPFTVKTSGVVRANTGFVNNPFVIRPIKNEEVSLKQGDVVKFIFTEYNEKYEGDYQLESGEYPYLFDRRDQFVYLCEINQIPGHCVVMRLGDNKLFSMHHTDDFQLVSEDEL